MVCYGSSCFAFSRRIQLRQQGGVAFGIISNPGEVLDCAALLKTEAVLHGHQHQPSITQAKRWPNDFGRSFLPVASIQAGSFGATRELLGTFSRNHYFILLRKTDEIQFVSRVSSDSGLGFSTQC